MNVSKNGNVEMQIDENQFDESFEFLANSEGKIVKNEETICHINNIECLADNGGLSVQRIKIVVNTIIKIPCDSMIIMRLLNALAPASTIPSSVLVDLALWGLGSDLSELRVVQPVLRVIVYCLQYNCVDDKHELISLYEMFMALLRKEKLTNLVAELLLLLTSSNEVTEWRVRQVMSIQSKHGSSHQLDSLLWTFRQWRPDLIPNCKSPASRVTSLSSKIAKRIHAIWERNLDNSLIRSKSDDLWVCGIQVGNVFKKHMKTTLLPSNDVLPAKRDRKQAEPSKSVGNLKSLHELIDNIHNIQLPANIVSLLGNSGCIQILALDQKFVERLSINIYHLLRNEFLYSDGRKVSDAEHKRKLKRRKSILEMIVKLQEQIQHSLPVVGRFLTDYLEHWDGKTHFPQFVNLISQLQLTDYKELHDCIISPIMNKHFQTFSTYKRLVLISNLHKLLRNWAVVELERFTHHRRTIFPINNVNCINPIESMFQLGVSIGELSSLALSLVRQEVESTHMLSSNILIQYRCTQTILIKYKVPVKLDLPSHFLYDSLFSHSTDLLSLSCQHILMIKKTVLPMLKKSVRDSELENGHDHPTTMVIEEMLSQECMESLQTAVRDFLVFLSPGQVNLTPSSILRQGWALPEGEDSLKVSLYLSNHPALLPVALEFVDGLNLEERERQSAWIELGTEQEEDGSWETNISINEERQKIVRKSFYGSKTNRITGLQRNKEVKGNILEFLRLLSRYFPDIYDLIMEFKIKSTSSSRLPIALSQKETDLRSMISQRTEDSGVDTLLTRSSSKIRGVTSTPMREKSVPTRKRKDGVLTDSSNKQR